jgi:hypothetical protein
VERHFDRLTNGRWVSTRTESRTESPRGNRIHGLLIETMPESLGDSNISCATICRNDCNEEHGPLNLCRYRLIRELRLRAIQAGRSAVSAGSGVRDTTTCVKSFAKAEATLVADSGRITLLCSGSFSRITAVPNVPAKYVGHGQIRLRVCRIDLCAFQHVRMPLVYTCGRE